MSEGERAAATGEARMVCYRSRGHSGGHDYDYPMRGEYPETMRHLCGAPREPEPPAQPTPEDWEVNLWCLVRSLESGALRSAKRAAENDKMVEQYIVKDRLLRAAPPSEREARLEEALREADEYTWHHSGCAMWPPDRGGLMPGEPDPCDCGYRGMLDMVREALWEARAFARKSIDRVEAAEERARTAEQAADVLRSLMDSNAEYAASAKREALEWAAREMCSACRADGWPDERGYHSGVESCQAWPIPSRLSEPPKETPE